MCPVIASHIRVAIGSSGRIRTYDQSVNPDCVGTLSLSYMFKLTRRSRIRRADFQDLISRFATHSDCPIGMPL